MTTKFRVSPVMTTSISLRNYDALVCIIIVELDKTGSGHLLSESTSHTPPEDRQARLSGAGCGYFAEGEISLRDAYGTYLTMMHSFAS